MRSKYIDYYSQYESIVKKALDASFLADTKEVSNHLSSCVSDLMTLSKHSKISGENDNVINLYNEQVESIYNRLIKLNEFASFYFDVEEVYCDLCLQLRLLEDEDNRFKKKSNNKPSVNSYKIIVDGKEEIDYVRYNMDVIKWHREMNTLESYCRLMSESVESYIKYLRFANSLKPKNGLSNTNIKRPDFVTVPNIIKSGIDNFYEDSLLDSRVLSGEELEKFLFRNNIKSDANVTVVESKVNINDVLVNTYIVYNNDENSVRTDLFKQYVYKSIEYEKCIDSKILEDVFTGEKATEIVFVQNPETDIVYASADEHHKMSGYYDHKTKNITMLYLGTNDYYSRVLVHETAHAYDKFLGEKLTDWDANWYSLDVLDMRKIVLNEVQNFDETHSSVIYGFKSKASANSYLRRYCINANDSSIYEDENGLWNITVSYDNPLNPMGATYGGHIPGYSTHDYVYDNREYFADAFQLYWLGDYDNTEEGGISRLEFLCPETYQEMYKTISADINGELDKYSLVVRYD